MISRGIIFLVLFLMAMPVSAFINYSRIDRYARYAPVLKQDENLDQLVNYLVYPYQTDQEKARSLLAWVVSYVDYDTYVYKSIQQHVAAQGNVRKLRRLEDLPQNDILKVRAGVCADIAALYKKMCDYAGLEAVVITGNVSGCTFEGMKRGFCAHAWNAVKIDGHWEYVDPTWAMGASGALNVSSRHSYEYEIKKRENNTRNLRARRNRHIDDQWFLTNKDAMIKTHFPDNERWQLQSKKITEAEFLHMSEYAYQSAMNKYERRAKRQEQRNLRWNLSRQ